MNSNIDFQKKNIKKLIKKIFLIKECISVNIVGSFTENINLNKVGDLDIVIISKKISKKFINECKSKLKKHEFPTNKKIKINDTFGPLKYDKEKYLVIHLMVYDVDGHINHVIKSPFTCFDWERKNIYIGKSLKEIYSVNTLQLRDFFNSRRAVINHFNDIKNSVVSTYSYLFNKINYKFINHKTKLNKLNKRNYCKHIIKHNLTNFGKLYFQKNSKLKSVDFNRIEINNEIKKYYNFDFYKEKLDFIDNETKNFLYKFFVLLGEIKNNSNKIVFMRHAKTKLNKKDIFFGRKTDKGIINFKNNDKKIYDKIFCSPLKRSKNTAKKFKTKKIKINSYLNEIDYGLSDGLTYDQLKIKNPNMIKNWSLFKDPRFPNGENLLDVSNRVSKFIKKLEIELQNRQKQNYLIVTHNVFLRCLLGKFLNIAKKDWFKLKINHLDKLEFVMINNKIVPNIDRKKIFKIIKYKVNEASSIN